MVRLAREEMAHEREALAVDRERECAHFGEARRRIDERGAEFAEPEEGRSCARIELDNERQLRITEADVARMAAAERDEVLRNQLAETTNVVQALCEEKRRWKEERGAQMSKRWSDSARKNSDKQATAKFVSTNCHPRGLLDSRNG